MALSLNFEHHCMLVLHLLFLNTAYYYKSLELTAELSIREFIKVLKKFNYIMNV